MHRTNLDGLRGKCKTCNNAYTRAHNEAERDRVFKACGQRTNRSLVKARYGITIEEYIEAMNSSDVCQCCGKPKSEGGKFVYDHCHDTMKFRGVLCDSCNVGIGRLGDTLAGVKNAVRYLEGVA